MRFSLLQPLLDLPIAVVDTETTGASAAFGHKVIEIGIVRIERGQTVARYEQLIDPGRRISPGVTFLTGISQEMVDGQPKFKYQLPEIIKLFEGAAILGHKTNSVPDGLLWPPDPLRPSVEAHGASDRRFDPE